MANLSSFISGGGIKSIQTGTLIPVGGSTTASITAVNTAKSFVLYGGHSTFGSTPAVAVRVELTNSTTVTATCTDSTGSTVAYTVVEFN